MPISDLQREQRRAWVGGSDVAAILGLDPYKSPLDVYLDKTQPLEDTRSTAAELGNLLEPAVIDYAEQELGPLVRGELVSHPDLPLAVNLDARTLAEGEPVDAKTSGLLSGRPVGLWGAPYTDEVPVTVLVQISTQLLCTEAEAGYVAALLAGRGFTLYRVVRSPDLLDEIAAGVADFWEAVQKRRPPSDSVASLDTLKRLPRIAGKTTPIDGALVDELEQAREHLKAARDEAEVAEARVLMALGDGEIGRTPDGRTARYLEIHKKEHTQPASSYRRLYVNGGRRHGR